MALDNKDYDYFFNQRLQAMGRFDLVGKPKKFMDDKTWRDAHDWARKQLGRQQGPMSAKDRRRLSTDDRDAHRVMDDKEWAKNQGLDSYLGGGAELGDSPFGIWGLDGNGKPATQNNFPNSPSLTSNPAGGAEDSEVSSDGDDEEDEGEEAENSKENAYDEGNDGYSPDTSEETNKREDERDSLRNDDEDDEEPGIGEDAEKTPKKAGEFDPNIGGAAGDEGKKAKAFNPAEEFAKNEIKKEVEKQVVKKGLMLLLENPYAWAIAIILILLLILAMFAFSTMFPGEASGVEKNGTKKAATICLDAGHPGAPGEPGGAGGEAQLNLIVAKETKAELVSRGYTVIMTRSDKNGVPLADRAKICANGKADFMYSFHADGTSRKAGYPYQIYMKSDRKLHTTSKSYAKKIQAAVYSKVKGISGLKDGGTCQEGSCTAVNSLQIFSGADSHGIPAVLTEMVQLKNGKSLLDNDTSRAKLVEGIADGIQELFPATSNDGTSSSVVEAARKWVGNTPYSWGGGGINGPTFGVGRGSNTKGFDCSGLAMYAIYNGTNKKIVLPHSSLLQSRMGGAKISKKDLKPGDLVFFGSPVHHVGVYMGNDKMIEAQKTGTKIMISSINNRGFVWGKRFE